jgi:hypothetical protein
LDELLVSFDFFGDDGDDDDVEGDAIRLDIIY